ncbi:Protein ULTRAPETALA 1 [Camellia lanceoleosa]|nr:Protein ULTRAPETALA 1 [Camellia lanceoleosa]
MDIVVYGDGATMFRDEELEDISEIERGPNFVEVKCLLKSQNHGEQVGNLKVFLEGKIEINYGCVLNCQEDGKRVPLRNTPLLKYYYRHQPREVEGFLQPRQAVHHDEFMRCLCGKERRFHPLTMIKCRMYHEAFTAGNWTCAQSLHKKITCQNEEERQSSKALRGCPKSPKCKDCMACVCVGCSMCRFEDFSCQTCINFIQNIGQ